VFFLLFYILQTKLSAISFAASLLAVNASTASKNSSRCWIFQSVKYLSSFPSCPPSPTQLPIPYPSPSSLPTPLYSPPLHCKKRLAVFPSPTGMSLTKLSLARNNLIIPAQGGFGKGHPGWGQENRKPFLQCTFVPFLSTPSPYTVKSLPCFSLELYFPYCFLTYLS
jgi:hypothetical protein